MNEERLQFWSLYLARFATGFGYVTLVTLIPFYLEMLNASDFMAGLFITGFTLAQTIAVIPLAWAGDSRDKRRVLLAVLLASTSPTSPSRTLAPWATRWRPALGSSVRPSRRVSPTARGSSGSGRSRAPPSPAPG